MSSGSLGIILVAAMVALAMISFWRQVLFLMLSLLIAMMGIGLYQVIHFLRR